MSTFVTTLTKRPSMSTTAVVGLVFNIFEAFLSPVLSLREIGGYSSFYITPRACARVEQLVLSICLSVSTKIGDLGVITKCKYHYSIGKVGKLTFFSLLDS